MVWGNDPYTFIEDYGGPQQEAPMKAGAMVRVKKPLADPRQDLMYGGFYALIMKREGIMAFIDSDEWCRATGRLQAVSFTGWFSVSDLEEIDPTTVPVKGGSK